MKYDPLFHSRHNGRDKTVEVGHGMNGNTCGVSLQYNEFQRTVIYAVSLGGDTDTIASMAGAIAGACYGIDNIPAEWSDACEATHAAMQLADKLYEIVSAGHDVKM